MFRIGQGIDAHRFSDGGRLVLGGVEIPHHRGVEAHSDGDVLLHALCDALLGAIAAGDIGQHFPDTDAAWKGADSRRLLRAVLEMVRQAGYAVVNMDATLVAQAPRLAPWIDRMREVVASELQVDGSAVSVKATTTEHMGFTGRKEGLMASVVVLVRAVHDT